MEKKYGKANIQKAIDGEYWVGMAEEIAWLPHGEAINIRTTSTKEGKTETWYFLNTRTTISLRNHRVVAITKSNY